MGAVTLVDMGTASAGAQSSRSMQFNILSLPDPANDDASVRDYMLVSSARNRLSSSAAAGRNPNDIYEIQMVAPHSGKYASYFVGSRIISNPALHVTTRVDPLFFALAHFQRAMSKGESSQLEKWQPWDQALGDMPAPVLRALDLNPNLTMHGTDGVGQLGHLVEMSDMCGDDLILCKFSEERALEWLVAKYERSVTALRKRLEEKKRRCAGQSNESQGESGAFSSSFTLADDESKPHDKEKNDSGRGADLAPSKEEERSVKVGALQLICDYIPTEWKRKLSKEVGLTEEDWMGKKKTKSSGKESNASGVKRSREAWEGSIGQEDADALLQYTTGGGGKSASVITPGDKKNNVQNAQSVGLKKLAKVNTKGMKSLASFFGASKKKKASK
ncbi:hypothetical protein ACHAWF_011109 [Thalassiosira exigua]